MIKSYNAKQWEIPLLLDGRKTVTRRLVKPQHLKVLDSPYHKEHPEVPDDVLIKRLCEPPYQSGDILYVRETWDSMVGISYGDLSADTVYFYKAEGDFRPAAQRGKWRPSIHMPKEAARIWLKVTDVRVGRLRDIDGIGILAEGVNNGKSNPAMGIRWENMQRIAFQNLWNSTIKKSDLDRYGWDANPYVFVIEFERCEKPESEG